MEGGGCLGKENSVNRANACFKVAPSSFQTFLCASNAIWSSPPFAVSLVLFFDENGKTRTGSYWCGFGAVTFASLMSINAAALLR